LEAVKQNGLALEYVEKQNYTICLEALKQDIRSFNHIKWDEFGVAKNELIEMFTKLVS
ncbi:DUF4116 domain-containing protein, partial [Clostridioides difficile]